MKSAIGILGLWAVVATLLAWHYYGLFVDRADSMNKLVVAVGNWEARNRTCLGWQVDGHIWLGGCSHPVKDGGL